MSNTLKKIIAKMHQIAEKAPEFDQNDLWLSRSKETANGWDNQATSIEVLLDDPSDEYFYNVWCNCTDDGIKALDSFVETELIPNGLRLLAGKDHGNGKVDPDTRTFSRDGQSVRYMIANPSAS